MGKEFSSIYELRDIYNKKEELSQRELLLSRPTLTDYSMLPYIYECFAGMRQPGKPLSPTDRMKFLFIALFLYAPSSLAGRKMPDGLRAALSSLFPSLSPCVLSNNKKQTVFFYEIYKRYGEELDAAYREIVQSLEGMNNAGGNPHGTGGAAVQLPFVWE